MQSRLDIHLESIRYKLLVHL